MIQVITLAVGTQAAEIIIPQQLLSDIQICTYNSSSLLITPRHSWQSAADIALPTTTTVHILVRSSVSSLSLLSVQYYWLLLTQLKSCQSHSRCRICSICWPAAAKYTRTDEDLVTTLRHISLASYLRFKAEQTFRDTNWDSSYLITFGALSRGCDILIERNGNLYP